MHRCWLATPLSRKENRKLAAERAMGGRRRRRRPGQGRSTHTCRAKGSFICGISLALDRSSVALNPNPTKMGANLSHPKRKTEATAAQRMPQSFARELRNQTDRSLELQPNLSPFFLFFSFFFWVRRRKIERWRRPTISHNLSLNRGLISKRIPISREQVSTDAKFKTWNGLGRHCSNMRRALKRRFQAVFTLWSERGYVGHALQLL